MAKRTEKYWSWNWRSFVSFSLLFSGIALLLSGIILFIAPSGRVARDINWRILGLDKEGWEAVHTVIGYISVIFAGLHLILNRRFLINYLRNRARQFRLRPEFILALILIALLSLGSALN
jgi:hypothetical protein